MSNKLTMKFDPSTIQHLGIKMYSQVPAALAELLANAYDADATKVTISLFDGRDKKIIVEDNGIGMSFQEINDRFLLIGRNRREEKDAKTERGRWPSGKKGLGKLALFGLGQKITIHTKNTDSEASAFAMDWEAIKSTKNGDYRPETIEPNFGQKHGTKIVISGLKRVAQFYQDGIVNSLSKLFTCFDDDFKVEVSVNGAAATAISQNSKFEALNVQFEWGIVSDELKGILGQEWQLYLSEKQIKGKILTPEKPLKPGLRGVALYARKRLINLPEFFGNSDSSHFYSYATGIIEVDFIDEHGGEDDLISTNRQALTWEHEETKKLKAFLQHFLQKVQQSWRDKRKEASTKEAKPSKNFELSTWLNSLPKDKAETITNLLDNKMQDNDTASKKDILIALHGNQDISGITPEYAEFHWRYLHSKIKESERVQAAYRDKRYTDACDEATKIFTRECRIITQNNSKLENDLMKFAFNVSSEDDSKLPAIHLIQKNDGLIFKNIQNGYRSLAQGMYSIFRNVVSHNTENIVKEYITENDCLDILSLVSHLLNRLDRRISPKP